MKIRLYSYILPVAVILALWGIPSAHANEGARGEFESTFQQMLKDPADVDTTLKYANLAIELQDYEAAIPALERILLFNPTLQDIRLEVGVLYYKLKSYDMAEVYLKQVTTAKDADANLRMKASHYLERMREGL
jgi:tetratricopeptide (TPR) repeat protein